MFWKRNDKEIYEPNHTLDTYIQSSWTPTADKGTGTKYNISLKKLFSVCVKKKVEIHAESKKKSEMESAAFRNIQADLIFYYICKLYEFRNHK